MKVITTQNVDVKIFNVCILHFFSFMIRKHNGDTIAYSPVSAKMVKEGEAFNFWSTGLWIDTVQLITIKVSMHELVA